MPKGIYKRKPITKERKKELYSNDWRKKQAEAHKGQKPWNTGKKRPPFSKEWKEKITKNLTPNKGKKRLEISKDKHWNWKGGISNNPYPLEFNSSLKLQIRTRDNFVCVLCKRTEREELEELNRVLCVNHIDFDKNNCKEDNLNTLCLRCNVKINRDRDYWTNYFEV